MCVSDHYFSISVPSRLQSIQHSYGKFSHWIVSSACSYPGFSNCSAVYRFNSRCCDGVDNIC